MYTLSLTAIALSALALTGAIQIESPDKDTIWKSGDNSQTVSWKAVSTDATSFVVQLVNQAGFLADSPVTLIANQSTGSPDVSNSATITFPNGNWPEGTAFQINFVSSERQNGAILAQSNQFNITSGGDSSSSSSSAASSTSAAASSSSSASGTAPSTLSQASASAASAATSATSGAASGNIPNASAAPSSGSSSGAMPISAPQGLAALAVGAIGLAVTLL